MTHDLRKLLRDRGIKQKDIASKIGVSEPTISQWLDGIAGHSHRKVPAQKVKALARLLGIHAHDIRPDVFEAPRSSVAA